MGKKEKNNLKNNINEKHIKFYDKALSAIEFMLDEYSRELIRADIDFLEMPKNAVATIDFLISAIGKIQKGQRLALGLDEGAFDNTEPQINIIEGLSEQIIAKIYKKSFVLLETFILFLFLKIFNLKKLISIKEKNKIIGIDILMNISSSCNSNQKIKKSGAYVLRIEINKINSLIRIK